MAQQLLTRPTRSPSKIELPSWKRVLETLKDIRRQYDQVIQYRQPQDKKLVGGDWLTDWSFELPVPGARRGRKLGLTIRHFRRAYTWYLLDRYRPLRSCSTNRNTNLFITAGARSIQIWGGGCPSCAQRNLLLVFSAVLQQLLPPAILDCLPDLSASMSPSCLDPAFRICRYSSWSRKYVANRDTLVRLTGHSEELHEPRLAGQEQLAEELLCDVLVNEALAGWLKLWLLTTLWHALHHPEQLGISLLNPEEISFRPSQEDPAVLVAADPAMVICPPLPHSFPARLTEYRRELEREILALLLSAH